MLYPESAESHKLGPKDIAIKDESPVMEFGVVRTTNQTGEQLSVSCPVYGSDSRQEVKKRLAFCYSIMQDRLEEENKAVMWHNEKQSIIRTAESVVKKNDDQYTKSMKKIDKDLRQKNITTEEAAEKKKHLQDTYDKVIKLHDLTVAHAKQELEKGENIPYSEDILALRSQVEGDECSQEDKLLTEA